MLLGKPFAAFVKRSPVSVMVRGTVERIFDPAVLNRIFEDRAVLGYSKELTFSQCVQIMSDVVFRVSPAVGAYYKAHEEEIRTGYNTYLKETMQVHKKNKSDTESSTDSIEIPSKPTAVVRTTRRRTKQSPSSLNKLQVYTTPVELDFS